MLNLLKTKIGWLRLVGFIEGSSLVILVFVAMPLKYFYDEPEMVRIVGSIHGGLFLLYVFQVLITSFNYNWNFTSITWKLLLASVVPFGTFYVDKTILSKMDAEKK